MPQEGTTARALRCHSCRIVLRAEPVWHDDRPYCCDGCAAGGPCSC